MLKVLEHTNTRVVAWLYPIAGQQQSTYSIPKEPDDQKHSTQKLNG